MILYIPNISKLKPIGAGHNFAYTDVCLGNVSSPKSEYKKAIQEYIKQKIDDYQNDYYG